MGKHDDDDDDDDDDVYSSMAMLPAPMQPLWASWLRGALFPYNLPSLQDRLQQNLTFQKVRL